MADEAAATPAGAAVRAAMPFVPDGRGSQAVLGSKSWTTYGYSAAKAVPASGGGPGGAAGGGVGGAPPAGGSPA
eukprot:12065069-Prorocentrum_lima.AAC.1